MTANSARTRSSKPATGVVLRSIGAYVGLTLAFSWGVWCLPVLLGYSFTMPLFVGGGFGPAVAAIATTKLRGGSVRRWLGESLSPRVERRWYALALGLPLAFGLVLGVVLLLTGGRFAPAQLTQVALSYPLLVAFTALLGGGQEEFGWRGFALPVLQARFDALRASVGVGVLWAVWHLPLFALDVQGYANRSFAVYTLLVVGFSVVFTWVYNGTGGSVLVAMLLHGGINAASTLGGSFVRDPTEASTLLLGAYAALVWGVAVGLLVRYGPETLSNDVAPRRSPADGGEVRSDESRSTPQQ